MSNFEENKCIGVKETETLYASSANNTEGLKCREQLLWQDFA